MLFLGDCTALKCILERKTRHLLVWFLICPGLKIDLF